MDLVKTKTAIDGEVVVSFSKGMHTKGRRTGVGLLVVIIYCLWHSYTLSLK